MLTWNEEHITIKAFTENMYSRLFLVVQGITAKFFHRNPYN